MDEMGDIGKRKVDSGACVDFFGRIVDVEHVMEL